MKKAYTNNIIRFENIFLRNYLFGILIFGVIYFSSKINNTSPGYIEQSSLQLFFTFIVKYLFILIHNYFIFRKYLLKNKIKLYIQFVILYLIIFTLFGYALTSFFGYSTYIFTEFISAFLITIFGLSLYIIYTWIYENINKTKRDLMIKKSEIEFLNKQISPHFLFNSINNLYGISLTSPELIADKLLELSELLRYQIESIKNDLVKIEEEIFFIDNYIKYTCSKYNSLTITNNIQGQFNLVLIPPLIFLPLIENAIKFSTETDAPFINIKWVFYDNIVKLTIENNFIKNGSKIIGTKTGIENLINRLELIKIKSVLKIGSNSDNIYKAELTIWELNLNA